MQSGSLRPIGRVEIRPATADDLAARGPLASNSVNQSEPVGAACGRLWTV